MPEVKTSVVAAGEAMEPAGETMQAGGEKKEKNTLIVAVDRMDPYALVTLLEKATPEEINSACQCYISFCMSYHDSTEAIRANFRTMGDLLFSSGGRLSSKDAFELLKYDIFEMYIKYLGEQEGEHCFDEVCLEEVIHYICTSLVPSQASRKKAMELIQFTKRPEIKEHWKPQLVANVLETFAKNMADGVTDDKNYIRILLYHYHSFLSDDDIEIVEKVFALLYKKKCEDLLFDFETYKGQESRAREIFLIAYLKHYKSLVDIGEEASTITENEAKSKVKVFVRTNSSRGSAALLNVMVDLGWKGFFLGLYDEKKSPH